MSTQTPQPYTIWSNRKLIISHVSKYIIPLVFGHGPDHNSYSYNSGTATLIDLGKGPLALTCEHVTTAFLEFKERHGDKANTELNIGGATGINRKIIASDKTLDIATLQLTKEELSLIPCNQNLCGIDFINEIYTGPIKKNDVIVFAGFPSQAGWRHKTGVRNLVSFHPCIFFAKTVCINNNNDYIICLSDYRVFEDEFNDKLTLTDDPTGMSGGPAFLIRQESSNLTYSFIGVVAEAKFFEKNCLTMYVKLAKRLNSDGTIKEAAHF